VTDSYDERLAAERHHYDTVEVFDDLPAIYHYWSHTYVRPMLEDVGCSNPPQFFVRYLRESAERCGAEPATFLSIGTGDCNNEITIAGLFREAGYTNFTIECLEMNPALIERSRAAITAAGLAEQLVLVEGDFNAWTPSKRYAGVMANQSLHHVLNLEHLFDAIKAALAPNAYFVISDMIGRNGHQRWPEARQIVDEFWSELPEAYRYNRQLKRDESTFLDWDCSVEGFEGIRSQDILPLLVERFDFPVFIGFGNVIDPFVDRSFGPNFDADAKWDREFVDRVHARDERELAGGTIAPTHMFAVVSAEHATQPHHSRGLTPAASIRRPTPR
jgi:SAM-dependent methyltransferase